ncbi:hypothetical protein [Streptomyces sp. NPDC102360]|uniref:hypothetical protein n=1 Tax=Streptomyces sp. NPDC102360 TaxID=3366160 RepID=UPI0038069F64
MSTAVKVRDPKTFVPQDVWERQVALILRDPGIGTEKAERIFGQTIAYFVTAGENTDLLVGPSVEVDKGVHSFMLDTDLCVQCTNDGGGDGKKRGDVACVSDDDKVRADGRPMVLEQTVKVIEAAGFAVDRELWNMGAKCTQCHAGCTDAPNTGKGK